MGGSRGDFDSSKSISSGPKKLGISLTLFSVLSWLSPLLLVLLSGVGLLLWASWLLSLTLRVTLWVPRLPPVLLYKKI